MSKDKRRPKGELLETMGRKAHAHAKNAVEPVVCPFCDGVAFIGAPDDPEMCPRCEGLGEVYEG